MTALELDVNAARMSHLRWEAALESLARGEGSGAPLKGHEDCDMGLWIYGAGLKRYGRHRSVWHVKEAHKEFHRAADETMAAVASGQSQRVDTALAAVRRHSCDILYLLTVLELDILEGAVEPPETSGPFGFILDFFGRRPQYRVGSFLSGSGRDVALNVNGARLAHIGWVRELQRAFRGQGRKIVAQPSEECELGVWLHGTALKESGDNRLLLDLDVAHKRFHRSIDRALTALNNRKLRTADEAYDDAHAMSIQIISLLTRLQLALEDSSVLSSRGGAKF